MLEKFPPGHIKKDLQAKALSMLKKVFQKIWIIYIFQSS